MLSAEIAAFHLCALGSPSFESRTHGLQVCPGVSDMVGNVNSDP